jgi:drug/metabolite transporter (DMT)-like permease
VPYAVLIGAQVAIGSAALLARMGLDAGLTPILLSAWRLGVASLLLWTLLFAIGPGRLPAAAAAASRAHPRTRLRLVAAGACLGGHFVVWFASLGYIPIARSTLLVTTSPVWSGLGGWLLLGHRLSGTFWSGLGVALVGAWMITADDPAAPVFIPASQALAGDALAVLGAILIAAYLLLVEDLQTSLGTRTVVSWTYVAAAVTVWLPTLALESGGQLVPRSAAAWASILGMAVVPQLVGHTALNWSLAHFPAGAVGAATLLEPVFAAALAWWLLAEPLTVRQVLGAAVLLAGVGLALRRSRRAAPRQ